MTIRRRKERIFVAFEGKSEIAFCAWLQDLCNEHQPNIYLDRPRRMSGGDPLALVECALKARQRSTQSAGLRHRHSCLLIDTDRLDDGSVRSSGAVALAEEKDLVLIRQRPCFEAVILRLHEGCEKKVPATAREALSQLRQVWPDYQKPPTRYQLAGRFAFAHLQRLAAVEPEIARLLAILGLPSGSK